MQQFDSNVNKGTRTNNYSNMLQIAIIDYNMNVRLTQEKTVHIVAVQAASADLVTKFNFKSKYK